MILILLLGLLLICLQFILSKKENKILALILPTITFLISIVYFIQSTSFLVGLKAFIIANILTLTLLYIYKTYKKI